MLQKQNSVSAAEVNEGEASEAESMAKLLERRQSMATSIAGDTLPSWNRELLSLGIERAELEASVKLLSARLERLASVVTELDRYDLLIRQREQVREELDTATHSVRTMRQRLSSMVMPEAFVESSSQQAPQ